MCRDAYLPVMQGLATDYLVVGAGTAGMAFTDSLVTESNADVVVVDRRHRPGGHWNDAYPFIRLHLPSAFYGVNSRRLGTDAIDAHGTNAGLYHRASGAEIRDYFGRVLDEQLLPTGRVRFFGMCDYLPGARGEHRVVSRLTGETYQVTVRRKLVDATYLEGQVPATHTPAFSVHPDVRLVPIGGLVGVTEPSSKYVLIGGGKTSIDACLWLLDNSVEPKRICWVRPRDAWLLNRALYQPFDLVASVLHGGALDMEALAGAESVEHLFRRLEGSGRLLRIDEHVTPGMFHCASVDQHELSRLRQVQDVVRLGRVLRLEPDRIVLEQGSIPAGPGHLYVDCSATGLGGKGSARPIFEADRITVQPVRICSPSLNSALVGYVEATRADVAEQNRLCPRNPYPDAPVDWLRCTSTTQAAARIWAAEPDLKAWVEASRLNLARGMAEHADDPVMQRARTNYAEHVTAGMDRLHHLLAQSVTASTA